MELDDLAALADDELVAAIEALFAPGRAPDLDALCRVLAGRVIELAVPGGALTVDLGDWTAILMIRMRAWEPHLSGLAAALVLPGAVAIDIGAHAGAWTLLLASLVGERGRVIAFEPFEPSAERARLAIRRAGLEERAHVTSAAVGERGGRALLYAGLDAEHARIDPMLRSLVRSGDDAVEVAVVALDEISSLHRVDFIKIDTEGFELAVMRGARGLLARTNPSLLIELHAAQLAALGHSTRDVVSELATHGYTVFDLRPDGVQLVVEPLGDRDPTTHHVLARRDPTPFAVPLR